MSEGKKTLVVVEDLDRVILQEQLIAMGLDIDVVVDREKAGSITTGLMALPSMRDEMLRIIGERRYGSDFRRDSEHLAESIAKEFNDFCLHYNFKALRDSTIGKLNYELSQGPNSGGNPEVQDSQREASVAINAFDEAQVYLRGVLGDIANELKGIKAAVTPPTLKVDLGAKPMDPRLKEFLLKSGPIGVGGFVDGMMAYINAVTGDEKPVAELNAWLDFVFKHPEVLKRQMQTYECRPVYSKEDLIKELTAALTGHGTLQLFPMALALNLNAKEATEMMNLLKPKVSFMGVHPGTFTPDSIFEVLLSTLREEVPSDVHLCGLSVLRAQERELVIEKLERVIGKQSIKVAGNTKELLIDGLSRALTLALAPNTEITIQGIDDLDKEDTRDLLNLLNGDREGTSTSIWHQTNTRVLLEKLTGAVGGNEVSAVTIHDLKCIDSRVKRNLHTALKAALEKYDELEARDKKLYVAGEQHIPATIHVKNGVGVNVDFGNYSFVRNEDGSLKIATKAIGGKNVSTFVLNIDGSIKLDNPGYMG